MAAGPGPDWDRIRAWANLHLRELLRDYAPDAAAKLRGNRCPCPIHGGEDPNFSLYRATDGPGELWHCHSAGCGSGGGVELVERLTGRDRMTVLRELARPAGVPLEDRSTGRQRAPGGPRTPKPASPSRAKPAPATRPPARPPEPTPEEVADAELAPLREAGIIPASRVAVHGFIRDALTLGPRGRAYLEGRGLDADTAAAFGFRSLEGAAWRALKTALVNEFTPEERAVAKVNALPSHMGAALVIPYHTRDGAPWSLRLRALEEESKGERYRTLGGDAVAFPFNAPALAGAAGRELHLVEGELNAYTLHTYGVRAVGVPGAKTPMRPAWLETLRTAARVVAWYDDDNAGDEGWEMLTAALCTVLPASTVLEHLRRQRIPKESGGKVDLSDLHRRGELASYLEGAAWRR